jgi:hypothetical protein
MSLSFELFIVLRKCNWFGFTLHAQNIYIHVGNDTVKKPREHRGGSVGVHETVKDIVSGIILNNL